MFLQFKSHVFIFILKRCDIIETYFGVVVRLIIILVILLCYYNIDISDIIILL